MVPRSIDCVSNAVRASVSSSGGIWDFSIAANKAAISAAERAARV